MTDHKIKRDARGRVLPGAATLNPSGAGGEKGGRPTLEYREMLRQMEPLAVATLIKAMQDTKNPSVQLQAARDVLDRLHGKTLQGELEAGTVNILVSADWLRMKRVMLDALRPFPEARLALAAALEEVAG